MIDDLDDQLRLFLHDSVKSYEELEALLFLAQNEGQSFSVEAVAEALAAPAGLVDGALEGLASVGGLVNVVGGSMGTVYRYAPGSESIRQRVVDLAVAYTERRMTVMQMLSANALERVRRSAMRRLANAFRLERDKK